MNRRSLLLSGAGLLAAAGSSRRVARAQAPRAVLRFVPSSNLATLDPVFSGAYVSLCHGYAVFDTLFGADAAQQVQPQMAEGMTVSDDGRSWTIRLREGLRFHDGEPVRAADCVASLARWSVQQASGRIVAGFLDTWTAKDDRTVVVALKRPMPSLAIVMATAVFPPFIMPERLAKSDISKPVAEMVGSGPFRFKADEYVSGSFAAYERFDGYNPRAEAPVWTAGGKLAKVPRIEWRIIPDAATAAAALQRGEVDWLDHPIADLVPVLRTAKDVVLGSLDPGGWTGFLRFNQLQPPFNKEGVRRAVMAALDQEDFLRVATADTPALYTVCKSVFPCGAASGDQPGRAAMPGNPEMAKAMLRQAGYGGEKVVLLGATDIPPVGDFAQVIADTMTRIGMNVELVSTDWGTVTQRRAKKSPVAEGGWSAFVSNINAPAIANPAVNFLIRGQGQAGYAGWYENAEMEVLARDWLEATTEAARADLASRIQALAFRTVPYVPLGQYVQPTAYRSSVSGILQGPAMLPWNVSKA